MSWVNGPEGGIAIGAARNSRLDFKTRYNTSGGVQPVLTSPQPFTRTIGQQIITVTLFLAGTNTPHFIWIINMQGGSNVLSNGYITSYDTSANYGINTANSDLINCTYAGTTPTPGTTYLNVFLVSTTAPDNRVYTLQFSPFSMVQPLIQCTTDNGGDSINLYDVEIKVSIYKFYGM